jgi:concanavalin A-like lectin/glucanase superfamily protein
MDMRRASIVLAVAIAAVGCSSDHKSTPPPPTSTTITPPNRASAGVAVGYMHITGGPPRKDGTTPDQPLSGSVEVRPAGSVAPPSGSSYRSTVMSDRPIAYWRFASTRSETGRHNGKLRGRPAPRLNQPGPFAGDRSIRFDGILRNNARTGGFLANSLARLASSTWKHGFTLEAWARTTTSGPEQHVMTWSDRAGNAGPGILYDDPSNRWKFRDGNVSLSEADRTTINAWHYLVASIDAAGHGTLYVDGVRERTWTSTRHPIATSTGLFTVGADYDGHDCPCPRVDTPFKGWIAETAVYAHPLTAARVRAHLAARRVQRRA